MRQGLSKREKEVAILVSMGYTDNEIAKKLYISRRRVGEIISIIKKKWNVRSRVQIGIVAYHVGLVEWKNGGLLEKET